MKTFRYGLVLVCFAVAVSILMGMASAETLVVDDEYVSNGTADFASIQAAVDAANAGDTIEVRSGAYIENVDVNKRLTLIGDGADVVTVHADNASDHVFEVTADYVNISGFTVTGAVLTGGYGIHLDGADHCNIADNSASNNYYGICLSSSSNNMLTNNTISSNNGTGIVLVNSSNSNALTNNNVSMNEGNGIVLVDSSNNDLTNNNVSMNEGEGIALTGSSYNTVINNDILNNSWRGIWLLRYSSENALVGNNASDNWIGIVLDYYNSNNTITRNNVSGNSWGIYFHNSSDSIIYLNNFVDNTLNVFYHTKTETNTCNSLEQITYTYNDNLYTNYLGNYWDDYIGSDPGGDGVGDTPYPIDSDADKYPLMGRWENYAIALPVHNLNTGEDFATIQAAIDDSETEDRHTITVDPGTYNENVDVNKELTIRSTSGNPADTIVQATGLGDHIFKVTADYVNISGFTVIGATGWRKAGIYLYGADHCNITDTGASNNHYGIYLNSSIDNVLTNNTALSNEVGIYLNSASDNTLSGNNASRNRYGIHLKDSSNNNTLSKNTASDDDNGIYLYMSSNNTLTENTASENQVGINLLSSSNNTLLNNTALSNNDYGIYLYMSSSNTLSRNTVAGNTKAGIYLSESENNMLSRNNASDGHEYAGIKLRYSSDNTLSSNNASSNHYGIHLESSSNNTLTNNTLSNNTWDLYIWNSESTFGDNTLGGTTISFTYEGDVSLKGVGSPAPDPAGWNTIGKFINVTNQSVGAWIFLNFSYSGSDLSGLDESSLKVWKHNGTAWIEDGWNKTRYLDTEDNVIGVNITSFSVFAPAALAAAYIPPDPAGLANTTGRYWVNYTWSAGSGNVTDSYNVSMNETWRNGTTETFMNVSVAPGGWANITVFAYNASGTETLSLGSISGNVQAAPPISHVNQTGWWRDGGAFNASGTPIQAAIDSATDGDTICVWNGSYSENVNVPKRLTLRGESADVVILTAADADADVFSVTADYVNISGFTVTGAVRPNAIRAGFYLGGADHCNISNNDASENIVGIYLDSASDNILLSNNASGNDLDGIRLGFSNNNMLTNNNANSNVGGGGCGIRLGSSSNNMLTNNTALENQHGIELSSSSNNMLTNNNASGNGFDGIRLVFSSNNTLSSNTVLENNRYGILLFDSSNNNNITNNIISDNTWDDLYIGSSESTFGENTLGGTTISFTYDGDVSLKGVGSPAPDPTGWNTIGKFIRATSQSAGAWIFLNFSYSGSDLIGLDESSLMVWKHNGTVWIEDGWNKTRYLDTEENIIGVNITTFSVFAPAALAAAYIPPDPAGLANTTGRYWVNYTWSAGTGNVTDSYNVSTNETWTNGTTETFKDVRVALGGWANITVFAYNASGTGMLSLESISDNVRVPPPTGINCTCDNICVNQTGWWRDGGVLNASGTPIQAAIGSATAGDTICVWNGSYSENVDVNKRLTLRGEGADVVALTAADADADVFNVTDEYVNISGFTVEGATVLGSAGIYLWSDADHCNLSGNTITNNYHGVHITPDATGTIINFNNIVGNSPYGYGLYNENSSVNATCNWWGDVSGPSGAGNGTGDAIYADMDYAPWLDSPYPEGYPIYFTNATTNTTGTGTTEIDALEVADTNVTISTTAPVNVTIGNYSRNPGASLEGNITKYIDVHVNNTTNVDWIKIRLYYTDPEIKDLYESSLRMYWWNSSAWVNCSDSGVHTIDVGNYSGYVWVNISSNTTPSLSEFNGSSLALRGRTGPPPPPVPRSRGRGTYPVLTPSPPTPTSTSLATATQTPEPSPTLAPSPSVISTSSPSPTRQAPVRLPTKQDIPLAIAMVAVVASAGYLILRRRRT